MDKKIIIVTGSSGRIGSNVVKALGKSYKVVGFELLRALYASDDEELVPVDLGSDESVHMAFRHIKATYGTNIAAVIHLAAYYSFSEQHSPKYEQITVEGTKRLLRSLQEFNVEQFLFSSTMLVHTPCQPGQRINEDSPIVAKWDYPLSKVHTEAAIHELHGQIPTVVLRVAGVYDDKCHSIPISHQIQRIYEKQLESRLFSGDTSHGASFVHMDDLVDAIVRAVERRSELPKETVLLIGEPKTMSYDQLQRNISRLLYNREFTTLRVPKLIAKVGSWLESKIPFHETFIQPWMIDLADDHYELDISRAEQLLGWTPKHSIEETLPLMIQDLKQNPAGWYKFNQLDMPSWLRKQTGTQ